ncbi:hypothetical protein PVAG01_08865 [Phlyctema vagabunda]|uniref:DUF7730 domain-containing protein n=1 Tax=Phlyctema vagabunda TaxID=108571 RepID=A0ABR4PBC8_9HELO
MAGVPTRLSTAPLLKYEGRHLGTMPEPPRPRSMAVSRVDMSHPGDKLEPSAGTSSRTSPQAATTMHMYTKFPIEIQRLIMRFALVSSEPIDLSTWRQEASRAGQIMTWTWTSNEATITSYSQKRADIRKQSEFKLDLSPNLMRVDRLCYSEGMRMFYGENTFRFTRVAFLRSSQWRLPLYMSTLDLVTFLSQIHHFDYSNDCRDMRNMRARGQLMRNIVLQDFDTDSDAFAKLQYGRFLSHKRLFSAIPLYSVSWQLNVLRIVAFFCHELDNLTIMADAQASGVTDYISGPDPAQPWMASFLLRYYEETEVLLREFQCDYLPTGGPLALRRLHVRGIQAVERDTETLEERPDRTAAALQGWLARHGISVKYSEYSGEFIHRWVRTDGKLVSEKVRERLGSGKLGYFMQTRYLRADWFGPFTYDEIGLCLPVHGVVYNTEFPAPYFEQWHVPNLKIRPMIRRQVSPFVPPRN